MAALEFLSETERGDGEQPMAGHAERIRKSLVQRRNTAVGLLTLAAQPLLDNGYQQNGQAVATVDINGQSVVVRAVANLRDPDGANFTLTVAA